MRHFLTVFMFLCSTSAFAWTPWSEFTDTEKTAYVLKMIAVTADYRQTTEIAKNPDKWEEGNPLWGTRHPSPAHVRNRFLITGLALGMLPFWSDTYRKRIQNGVTIGLVLNASRNAYLGLNVKF